MTVTIYHNPRCSKSRQTLALLEEKQVDINIVEYLKTPPSASELLELVEKLDMDISDIIRTKEDEYKQAGIKGENLNKQQIAAILAATPKLIERPIVVNGDKAVVGRPPENVHNIV